MKGFEPPHRWQVKAAPSIAEEVQAFQFELRPSLKESEADVEEETMVEETPMAEGTETLMVEEGVLLASKNHWM